MKWKVKSDIVETILENAASIADEILRKRCPNFIVALCYDEDERQLFVSEPYTTGTKLPYYVLYEFDDASYDIEGVTLDPELKPDEVVMYGNFIGRMGSKAFGVTLDPELAPDELVEGIDGWSAGVKCYEELIADEIIEELYDRFLGADDSEVLKFW